MSHVCAYNVEDDREAREIARRDHDWELHGEPNADGIAVLRAQWDGGELVEVDLTDAMDHRQVINLRKGQQ